MNSTYFLAPQAQIDLAKIAPNYRKPGLEKSCAGNPAVTKLGAASKSCWHTLNVELIHRHQFQTRDKSKYAIFEYIEVFHNRTRRHVTLQNNTRKNT